MDELGEKLDLWVRRRYITRAQANKILAAEQRAARDVPEPAPVPEAPPAPAAPPAAAPAQRPQAGVVNEIVGYLASILVLVATSMLAGSADGGGRVVLVGTVTAGLLAAGALVLREKSESAGRLASWLWFLSVLGFGLTFGLLLQPAQDARGTGVLVSGMSAAYATVLWRLLPRTLPQAAALVGVIFTLVNLLAPDNAVSAAMLIWTVGIGWAVGAGVGVFRPSPSGMVLGGIAALIGAEVLFVPQPGWGVFLGLATAAGFAAASARSGAGPLVFVAGLGIVVFVTEGMLRAFGDQIGPPVFFLIVGAALMVLVLAFPRLLERSRAQTPPAA